MVTVFSVDMRVTLRVPEAVWHNEAVLQVYLELLEAIAPVQEAEVGSIVFDDKGREAGELVTWDEQREAALTTRSRS